jgi:hypothetical protein
VSSIPTRYDCLGNLALLRRRAGCLTEARALGEQALAGREKRLTRDHHFSFAVAVNLVCGLAELDETEEVRKLGERTLRRMHELSGDDHPFTLGCAVNLVTGSADRRRLGSSTALPAQTMERYFVRLGSASARCLATASPEHRLLSREAGYPQVRVRSLEQAAEQPGVGAPGN